MRFFFRRIFRLPFQLILMGIFLGYLARWVWGPPPDQGPPPRVFEGPVVEPQDDEFTDLPLIR
jgi:hypothetical protein